MVKGGIRLNEAGLNGIDAEDAFVENFMELGVIELEVRIFR